jgi:hypothetical protein
MDEFAQSIDEMPVDNPKAEKRSTLLSTDLAKLKNRKGYIAEKLDRYMKYIRILDFLCALLIITGGIISQVENEIYYYDNIFYRVIGVNLMNGIFKNPTGHTLDNILSTVNVVALTDFTGSNVTGIGHNYLKNNETYNYTDVLSVIDFSNVGYNETITNWYDLNIYLTISPYNNRLRWSLFITTMISSKYIIKVSYWTNGFKVLRTCQRISL